MARSNIDPTPARGGNPRLLAMVPPQPHMTNLATMIMPNFDVNIPAEWTSWLRRFKNMLIAQQVTDPVIKKARLLHVAGADVFELSDRLPEAEGTDVFEATAKQLTDYFKSLINVDYEYDKFLRAEQHTGETIDSYVVRLRKLASTCEFVDTDRQIKQQIIFAGCDHRVRDKALQRQTPLQELIHYARMLEQAREIEQYLKHTGNADVCRNVQPKVPSGSEPKLKSKRCYRCNSPQHFARDCPCKDKYCERCGKLGHSNVACHTKIAPLPNRRAKSSVLSETPVLV